MKQLFVLVLIMLSFSCTEKIVQLPATTNKDITEVLDVSPIYMFYDEETDSVEFNRRNMISTTNWLVNIDKRLTLKQILPHLQYLQKKRHGDGMHKNENARNYFTCNNTDLKNLSFIEFTDVIYHQENSGDYLSKISNLQKNKTLTIDIDKSGTISVFFLEYDQPVSFTTEKNDLINSIKEFSKDNGEVIKTVFYFNSGLTFQDYIDLKTFLFSLNEKSIIISKDEFIYN